MGQGISNQIQTTSLDDINKGREINREGIYLIWVGPVPSEHTELTLKTKLKGATSSVKICCQLNTCTSLVKSITKEKVFIIMNAIFNETTNRLLEELSKLNHVDSIFILDSDESRIQLYEKVLTDFPKTIHFPSLDDTMIDAVRQHIRVTIKTTMEISMFDQGRQSTTRDLTKNMADFLWFQVLLYVLRQLRHDEQAKKEMLDMCANYYQMQEDQIELKFIEEYRNTYNKEQAIYWYTRDCFLYKLLNKALRSEDVRSLFAFRTFIVDLCDQIDKLHKERISNGDKETIVLYRGQQMTKREQAQILASRNKLISTNGFISATKNAQIALAFALKTTQSADLVSIVFRIEAPSNLKNVVFADITQFSEYPDEGEILFSLGAAFKIDSVVEHFAEYSYTVVNMTATDEGHDSVDHYINSSKAEFESEDKKVILGRLLLDMGQYKESDNYFTDLIDYTNKRTNHESLEFAPLYHNKGRARACMGSLKEALALMSRAQNIREQYHVLKTPELAQTLNSIGVIEGEMGHYQKAMQSFEDALYVFQQPSSNPTSTNSQLQIATTKSNIGWVQYLRGNYEESHKYHLEALDIRAKLLPKKHALIADNLNALGALRHAQGRYDEAKKLYTEALIMRQQTLPDRHPSVASSCQSLGNLELENGRYENALELYEKAHSIYSDTFGEDHSFVASSYKSIGSVFLENSNHDKALEYFELARQILIRNLLEKHPSVGECYHFIGIVHERKALYRQAIANYEKALDIFSNHLAVDHPSLSKIFMSMANTYMRTGDYQQAEMNLQRAHSIQKDAYSTYHPDIVLTLNNLGVLYTQIAEYDKAKDYLTQAINMCEKCYPPSHLAVARTLFNLGEVYANKGEYDTAVQYYKRAIEIQEEKLPPINLCKVDTHNRIAAAYVKLNKVIEAQQHLMKSKNFYEDSEYSIKNPDFAQVMKNLRSVNKAVKRRQ
jgi:tetratricopeptide (TPR) repeat protein